MKPNVLWIISVIIAIVGVITLIQGNIIWGVVLLVAAAAVGPGGWTVFNKK